MAEIRGAVVIVTAPRSGIGAATARAFGRAGCARSSRSAAA
jgi:NADP-dependent 3-hydroxy acid dehydrogenase YdfG